MTSTLNVTKQLTNSGWVLTANIDAGGIIPREIFVYENSGTDQLGPYVGIVSVTDLPRIQIWQSSPIPVFGNKYVRHSAATIVIEAGDNPDTNILALKSSIQDFSTKLQAIQTSTQVFTII
jgi:hypothetical protein